MNSSAIDQRKKPDGNQALKKKLLQGNYNMKRKKEQWKPKVTNIMADGSVVEDLTGYIIPAGHQYYQVIKRIYSKEGA